LILGMVAFLMTKWVRLITDTTFQFHRVVGLLYLVLWVSSLGLYFWNYSFYANKSGLDWWLPLTGLIQSCTAAYYFTFLPTKPDPGYYSDKNTLSYQFVQENSFFALLLLWQCVYLSNYFYPIIHRMVWLELIMVFIPYVFRDMFWPKTSFRDSIKNARNKTFGNRNFIIISTWITKCFYIWAKHYIGFFLNYVRFLNQITSEQQYYIHLLLIWSGFATTIAMFLHTLKFKGYIGPRTALMVYMASYMATFYSFVCIYDIFMTHGILVFLTFLGVICNLWLGSKVHHVYQVLLGIGCLYVRLSPQLEIQ
jgi:hypothetical protein